MINLYLGIELNDSRRLLSEFDVLLENSFHVLPTDEDNKYLIRLSDFRRWMDLLYIDNNTGKKKIRSKIKDIKFSLCTVNGKVWRELTRTEQDGLRVGIDDTYQGTTGLNYTIYLYPANSNEPELDIDIEGCKYKGYKLSEFQKALNNPTDSMCCSGINNYIFNTLKGFSYDMIFDMYRKGYIKLDEERLKWFKTMKTLGL